MSLGMVVKLMFGDSSQCSGPPAVVPDAELAEIATPAARERDFETPNMLKNMARVLVEQNLRKDVFVQKVLLRASCRLRESDLRSGKSGRTQTMDLMIDPDDGGGGDDATKSAAVTPDEWWRWLNQGDCTLPYALAVQLVGYDMSQMPFDLQVTLKGFATSGGRYMADRAFTYIDAPLNDVIVRRGCKVPRHTQTPESLLSRPLVCTERLTGVRFASIEAVGFDSRYFWALVAVRANEAKNSDYARFFVSLGTSATVGGDPSALHGSASNSGRYGFYYVPKKYRFTSLLVRVHTYLVLQRVRHESTYEIEPDAINARHYKLQETDENVIFEANSLKEVVRYVDDCLVNAHPLFFPMKCTANLQPVMHTSWMDAWTAYRNAENARNVIEQVRSAGVEYHRLDQEDKEFTCTLEFLIHFVVFRQYGNLFEPPLDSGNGADIGAGLHARISGTSTVDGENATDSVTEHDEGYTVRNNLQTVRRDEDPILTPSTHYGVLPITITSQESSPNSHGHSPGYGSWRDFVPNLAVRQVARADADADASESQTTAVATEYTRPRSNTTESDDDDALADKLDDDVPSTTDNGEEFLRPARSPPTPPAAQSAGVAAAAAATTTTTTTIDGIDNSNSSDMQLTQVFHVDTE